MRRHHPRLIRLCASWLSDRVAAEDAAQEVFVKAFRHLRRFRGDSSFSTWLYRIASRHCTDVLRARARHPVATREEEIQSPLPRPDQTAETAQILERLLAALPDEARATLILHEVEGLSYEEISDVLGCTLDAVKSRLKRARQALLEKARFL